MITSTTTQGTDSEVYARFSTPIVARDPERIRGLSGDLELLDPGLVNVAQWRPDTPETMRIAEKYRRPYFLAGVARKSRPVLRPVRRTQ